MHVVGAWQVMQCENWRQCNSVQIDKIGLTMGNPLSPILSDIYMHYLKLNYFIL